MRYCELLSVLLLDDVYALAANAVARIVYLMDGDAVELRRDVHDFGGHRREPFHQGTLLPIDKKAEDAPKLAQALKSWTAIRRKVANGKISETAYEE